MTKGERHNTDGSPIIGSITLTYECECGKHTPEYRKTCKFCGRPNPDYNVSPSFMASPVSRKSVVLSGSRHFSRTRTASRIRRGE